MRAQLGGKASATASAAVCLMLALWMGSCAAGPENPSGVGAKAGGGAVGTAAPAPQPAPIASPPVNTVPTAVAMPGDASPATSGPPAPGSGSVPTAAPVAAPTRAPAATPAAGASSTPAAPTPAPGTAPVTPGGPSGGNSSGRAGSAVYYVALDDGGSSGVRFGCNDSLVALHSSGPSSGEPLQTALQRLLGGGTDARDAGLYNALAGSSLKFVSGYFNGTTVVVNLTGTVQPGGVCDIPRVEAQLTQTAVTAVGVVRAEIYIDGVRLADVLSLR